MKKDILACKEVKIRARAWVIYFSWFSVGKNEHLESTVNFRFSETQGTKKFYSLKQYFSKSNIKEQRNNYEGTKNSFLEKQNFVITEFVKSGIHCIIKKLFFFM